MDVELPSLLNLYRSRQQSEIHLDVRISDLLTYFLCISHDLPAWKRVYAFSNVYRRARSLLLSVILIRLIRTVVL